MKYRFNTVCVPQIGKLMQSTLEVNCGSVLQLLLLIAVLGCVKTPIFSYQIAASIKGTHLKECWLEIGVLLVVIELDVSFYEANLSMTPID